MIERALPTDSGCWIDGHWGQYGSQRLVTLAGCYGFKQCALPDFAEDPEPWYYEAELAEEWMNENVAPEGFSFGWHDGEWFLWSNDDWSETE